MGKKSVGKKQRKCCVLLTLLLTWWKNHLNTSMNWLLQTSNGNCICQIHWEGGADYDYDRKDWDILEELNQAQTIGTFSLSWGRGGTGFKKVTFIAWDCEKKTTVFFLYQQRLVQIEADTYRAFGHIHMCVALIWRIWKFHLAHWDVYPIVRETGYRSLGVR